MKKTYIKPETTVVVVNVHDNVLQATSPGDYNLNPEENLNQDDIATREVIRSRGAWEEW